MVASVRAYGCSEKVKRLCMAQHEPRADRPRRSLQLRVLRLGLLQEGVGVFVIRAADFNWCPGTESNRHAPFGARDFKSRASASFAIRAALKTNVACSCYRARGLSRTSAGMVLDSPNSAVYIWSTSCARVVIMASFGP